MASVIIPTWDGQPLLLKAAMRPSTSMPARIKFAFALVPTEEMQEDLQIGPDEEGRLPALVMDEMRLEMN